MTCVIERVIGVIFRVPTVAEMEREIRKIECDAAVIVPVNPRTDLEADFLSPFPTKRTADIRYHVRHLKRNGGVIWHVRRSVPYISVHWGYFYESPLKRVTHSFVIREWLDYAKEPLKTGYERYLTHERKMEYVEDTSPEFQRQYPTAKFTGILIDEIRELDESWPLEKFSKLSDDKPVHNARSHPIVKYKELPCHPAEYDINTVIHKTIADIIRKEEVVQYLLFLALEEEDPSSTLARQVQLRSGRLDVVETHGGSKVKIFEVKAPSVAVGVEDLNQLQRYIKDLKKKYRDVEGVMVVESASDELRKLLEKKPDMKLIEYRFQVDFGPLTT